LIDMRTVDLIQKKREGGEHSAQEIRYLIDSFARGETPDYQMSAWMMALLLRGATAAEAAALTEAMLDSGARLSWDGLAGAKVDKHSTGGVGDKTSLIVGPVAAAGGLIVPMVSGRGLGHTGGTLDKLESIPGFNAQLTARQMRKVLEKTGCCITGQTAEIAPADKKMYALRDVTATVESPALICASIMSKKLAEGLDALVLDVKTGSGAFMKQEQEAEHLARLMVEAGERMGTRMTAVITDMSEPLGRAAGNALEVAECRAILSGQRDPLSEDLRELSIELAAWMFRLGGRAGEGVEAGALAERLMANGAALERFEAMARAQGATGRKLPEARQQKEFTAAADGFLACVDCAKVGLAVLALGGGRSRQEDRIDHAVGLVLHKKAGDAVRAGEAIAIVHYNDGANLEEALGWLRRAYRIDDKPAAEKRKLVKRIICQAKDKP